MSLFEKESSLEFVRDGLGLGANHCFTIRGHTRRCDAIIARRGHLLVGISPFNSRFSQDYIKALLEWGHSEFSRVDVLLPDEDCAALLLLATGVPPAKAGQKTRKELARHRRSIRRALDGVGVKAESTRVLDFSDFNAHSAYCQLHSQVIEAFSGSERFRSACEDMTRQAVHGRARGVPGMSGTDHQQVHLAVPYIFKELPFYLNSVSLLGVKSSVLAYHRPWPIGDALFAGHFPLVVDSAQGHGIVTPSGSCGALAFD